MLGGEPHQDAPVRIPLANAPAPSGPADIGGFLNSREGKALQKKVIRGVFGMLRKRL